MTDKEILLKAAALLKENIEDLRAQRAKASSPKHIAFLEGMIDSALQGMFALGGCAGRISLRDTMTPEQLAEFDAQQERD